MRGKRVVAGAMCAAMALAGTAQAAPQKRAKHRVRPFELALGTATNRFAEFGGPNTLDVWAFRRSATQVDGDVRGTGDLLPGLPGGDFAVEGPVTCLRVEPKAEGGGFRASIKYRYARSTGST